MPFARHIAIAALALTAGCGSMGTAPHTSPSTFPAPVGAPPRYLGPVTTTYTIKDEASTLSPPPAGPTPKLGWTRLLREICDVPGGAACSDGHTRIEVRLGILDMQSGWSPNIPSNGLVYYVTTTGIRCNTILVAPMAQLPGSRASVKPWPTWCQAEGFINAETGDHIGGGVGPMPGQQ